MERPEIVELLFATLFEPNDIEPLSPFLSRRVQWILSATDPKTLGEESPPNAIKFSGKQGFQELALYFRDSLHVISGDLTGCITHHQFIFAFGRVRLQRPGASQPVETNIAARITFLRSKIIKGQIRIAWRLVF
ncbi:MAG: hypothetical protein JOZ31_09440 [Verrucomicrobia bacterium]|nr:hypothetical protein [Verrucomicrobiota bacterium]